MIVWNGETLVDVSEDAAAEMVKRGEAVTVGPFDGLRVFPTKMEMLVAAGALPSQPGEYATKDMAAKPRGRRSVKDE